MTTSPKVHKLVRDLCTGTFTVCRGGGGVGVFHELLSTAHSNNPVKFTHVHAKLLVYTYT